MATILTNGVENTHNHEYDHEAQLEFYQAVHDIAVGYVEEWNHVNVGATALPPPPDPMSAKYNKAMCTAAQRCGVNSTDYSKDYDTWLKKVANIKAKDKAYKAGKKKQKAKDSKKLAAQKAASAKILDKVRSKYRDKIAGLKAEQQQTTNDAEKQKLQDQIDSLTQQSQAAAATQNAIAKDPDSEKSVAMQTALLQAAEKKPNDLTGMFKQMMMKMMQDAMPGVPMPAMPAPAASVPGMEAPSTTFEPAPGFDANIPDTSGHNDEIAVIAEKHVEKDGIATNLDDFDQLIEVESYTEQTGDDLEEDCDCNESE